MRKFVGISLVLAVLVGGACWLKQRGYVKIEIDLSPTAQQAVASAATVEPVLPEDLPEEPTPIEITAVATASNYELPPLPGDETPPIVIPEGDASLPVFPAPVAPPAPPESPIDTEPVEPATYKGRSSVVIVPAPEPRQMPYCEDDCEHACPRMPYIRETDDLQTRTEDEFGALLKLAEAARFSLHEESEVDSQSRPAETQKGKTLPSLPPSELTPIGVMPNCQEDGNYHRHYPGCPHAGHCTYGGGHYRAVPPYVEPSRPYSPPILPAGGEESTEEPAAPAPAKTGPTRHETMKPRYLPHPEGGIDTMEFRKTDRRIDEFGPGPF